MLIFIKLTYVREIFAAYVPKELMLTAPAIEMFSDKLRFLHGNGRGRRNVVGQAGNYLGLVLFFGQGNVSRITVLKRQYFL